MISWISMGGYFGTSKRCVMDLGFIIEQLQKSEAMDQDMMIAKGEWKIITKWSEAKEQIRWRLRKK